jgi:hypothetical protein
VLQAIRKQRTLDDKLVGELKSAIEAFRALSK